MRLSPRRLTIAGLAVLMAGTLAACSAASGLTSASAVKPRSAAVYAKAPSHAAGKAPSRPASEATTAPPAPANVAAAAPRGVTAKEGILADAATGQVLWAKDADTELPMASITKVMTAYLVIQAGDLNRQVTVPGGVLDYVAEYGAESLGLHAGEVFTAQELLYGLLVQSGADAAYTLALAYGPGMSAFLAKMNATARQLGMDDTHFASPDGLPYPTEHSTYSTPSDLLLLGQAAMKSPVFRTIVRQTQYHLPKGQGHDEHWWSSDNWLLKTYPGAVGIKTGFTDDAGHCLLFEAVRGGRTLMGVVLGSPATGYQAAGQDAARILNWGFGLRQAPAA